MSPTTDTAAVLDGMSSTARTRALLDVHAQHHQELHAAYDRLKADNEALQAGMDAAAIQIACLRADNKLKTALLAADPNHTPGDNHG